MDRSIWCRLTMIVCFTIMLSVAWASIGFPHTYGLPEADKRGVVRIVNPEGKFGTGFVLSDPELGFFMVTNKHLIRSTVDGSYFDSVLVYRNELTSKDKKVKSTTTANAIHLSFRNWRLYAVHEDEDVDLALIRLGAVRLGDTVVTNPDNCEYIYGFNTNMVIDTRSLASTTALSCNWLDIHSNLHKRAK